MALDSMDKLVSGLADSSTNYRIFKSGIASQTAGTYTSHWRASGYPVQAAVPTVATTCDDTMVGGIQLPTPVVNGKLYLAKSTISSNYVGGAILCDRLAHMGGLNGTLTASQVCNISLTGTGADGGTPVSDNRCQVDGSDVLWGVEVYTALGATVSTLTVTYTNESGVSGRTTTLSLAATRPAGFFGVISPNVADKAIKSIESVRLSVSTGTAGNFGITAIKPLLDIPFSTANVPTQQDFSQTGLIEINKHACLTHLYLNSFTTSGTMVGSLQIINI